MISKEVPAFVNTIRDRLALLESSDDVTGLLFELVEGLSFLLVSMCLDPSKLSPEECREKLAETQLSLLKVCSQLVAENLDVGAAAVWRDRVKKAHQEASGPSPQGEPLEGKPSDLH